MQITTKALAEHLSLDKQEVWRILSYLELVGIAVPLGKVPAAGKGRPSFVYEIPEKVELDFSGVQMDVQYKQVEGEKYLAPIQK